MIFRRAALAAILGMVSTVVVAQSCVFCNGGAKGPTLSADYAQASVVLLAHVDKAPQFDGKGGFYTDIVIDQEIKSSPDFKDQKTVRLKMRIEKKEPQVLLFCDVIRGKIQPYRAEDVPAKSELVKYLQGSIALKDKPIGDRLRYSFDYLNHPEFCIAVDAFRQFAIADYKDYRTMAQTLPADRIAGWLKDKRTPPYRYGLYSSLLGHCGTAEHARLLRTMIDEAIKSNADIDGLLAGYVMLQRKEGWDFVQRILTENKDFLVRNSCVRIASFVREQRPDLVPLKELTSTVAHVLDYPDMADMAIEFLRKAKAWDRTDQILDLVDKKNKDFDNAFVKRAVVAFALACPQPRAISFVNEMRRRNADFVAAQEELLKSESR